MIRRLVRRYGYFRVTLGITLSSMALATLLLVGFDLFFKGYVPAIDLLIVNLISGIIAPVMTNRFIRLIHQLDSAEERLKTLAREDPLTEIYNRRHFLELARREWDRARRYADPLSLVILDVDRFKTINDMHGHTVGDEVLRRIAHVLRESTRASDVVARYGGEEFVLLLPGTDLGTARRVADRVRNSIAAATQMYRPGGVTVSGGVCGLEAGVATFDELLQRADEALYGAKQSGRDRVELHWSARSGDKRRSAY